MKDPYSAILPKKHPDLHVRIPGSVSRGAHDPNPAEACRLDPGHTCWTRLPQRTDRSLRAVKKRDRTVWAALATPTSRYPRPRSGPKSEVVRDGKAYADAPLGPRGELLQIVSERGTHHGPVIERNLCLCRHAPGTGPIKVLFEVVLIGRRGPEASPHLNVRSSVPEVSTDRAITRRGRPDF